MGLDESRNLRSKTHATKCLALILGPICSVITPACWLEPIQYQGRRPKLRSITALCTGHFAKWPAVLASRRTLSTCMYMYSITHLVDVVGYSNTTLERDKEDSDIVCVHRALGVESSQLLSRRPGTLVDTSLRVSTANSSAVIVLRTCCHLCVVASDVSDF